MTVTLFQWHAAVPPAQLAATLAALPAAQFSACLLEWWNAPAQCCSVAEGLATLETKNAADCLSGSLFGSYAEITWRRMPGDYGSAAMENTGPVFWLALCAEQTLTLPAPWAAGPTWHNITAHDTRWLLWGSDYDAAHNQWAELRIPRPLQYPVTPVGINKQNEGAQAWLEVREYFAEKTGRFIASRRWGLGAQVNREKPGGSNGSQ
jgi:hypothetical protein